MENHAKQETSKQLVTKNRRQSVSPEFIIDSLIKQLKDYGQTQKKKLFELIEATEHIFQNEPNVLKLCSPIRIVGDIHGQFYDLLKILQKYGQFPEEKFLFLGDYVDRGLFCIEVITLLLALKCKYPKNIFMLRGNHEGKTMTQNFNFKLECIKKYDVDTYQRFLELFCKLPLCAIVDQKYFCVHGGISPQFKKIRKIRLEYLEQLNSVHRFKELDNTGLICDLLWSDPINTTNAIWEKNKIRSCSYLFSRKQAEKFVEENKIQLIIRGHEVQTKGFAYQTSEFRKKLTLTIFSAPNYCDTYKNKGGIAIIKKGSLSIETFSQVQHPFVFSNYVNVLQWSLPMIAINASKIFLHLLKTLQSKTEDTQLNEDQMDALNKIQCLNKLFEGKKQLNFSLLLQPQKISQKQDSEEFESIFSHKKINDQCQKYPHLPPSVIGPKHLSFKKIGYTFSKSQTEILPLQNNEFYT